MRDINLSGGEISILKALGLSGTSLPGKQLMERLGEMEPAEFVDELNGLIMLGYILASRVNLSSIEDVERTFFRVNASYARDLKNAITPSHRREEQTRRRRRRGSGGA
jgi:hypothetical protein